MTLGWRSRLAFSAVAVAAFAAPGLAKDKPKAPSLAIDPIVARNLLAPVEKEGVGPIGYRLDHAVNAVQGQRARLNVPVGESTLFAITGKLTRRPDTLGPIDERHAGALGQRRSGSKVYGAGIERHLGGVGVSATYQYSKLRAEDPQFDGQARSDGMGRSHSVRATARIRFRQ